MNFVITRETLLSALQTIAGVVERNPTPAILANLLLENSDEGLRLTVQDEEMQLMTTVEGDFGEAGSTTLPARTLLDIAQLLKPKAEQPEPELTFSFAEEGQATIVSGRRRWVLATLPTDEFPQIELEEGDLTLAIQQGLLKALLEKTTFAMAQQDIRYYLNGLLLEAQPDRLRAVATDGHRLAWAETELALPVKEVKQLIIPRKGAQELSKLLMDSDAEAAIRMTENHICVDLGQHVFVSKLIDGRFPDYARVVPEQGETPVVAEREALLAALGCARVIIEKSSGSGVRVSLSKDTLKVVGRKDLEEGEDEIDVEYAGDEMELGFNATYLKEAVEHIRTDSVNITVSSPKSGCLLVPHAPNGGSDAKYVVMPLLL